MFYDDDDDTWLIFEKQEWNERIFVNCVLEGELKGGREWGWFSNEKNDSIASPDRRINPRASSRLSSIPYFHTYNSIIPCTTGQLSIGGHRTTTLQCPMPNAIGYKRLLLFAMESTHIFFFHFPHCRILPPTN